MNDRGIQAMRIGFMSFRGTGGAEFRSLGSCVSKSRSFEYLSGAGVSIMTAIIRTVYHGYPLYSTYNNDLLA